MNKCLKAAALLLLLFQFSLVTSEFTRLNALAITDTAEENLILNNSSGQGCESENIAVSTLYYSNAVLTDTSIEGGVNENSVVKLANDPDGTTSNANFSSADYRHDFLLDNFWERYKDRIIIIVAVIILGALYWLYSQRIRQKHYKRIAASESMLRNISSNINGGVLVLNPQKEFRISYINEGLLKLMGYAEEEFRSIYEKDYYFFIYPEDRPELKKLIIPQNAHEEQDDNFSVSLRIKRKDGKYVPTLVKGSLVNNEREEKELFCMVMDISREQAMMEELQFEQESHRVLLEKSAEILFEINYLEQTVKVSPQFKEKFGWSLPKRYWGDAEPNLISIFEEDRWKFTKALKDVDNGTIDGEFIARICKSDGTPCWCKAIFHVMKIDGKNMRLIGKITDIDDEIKEKQSLMTKAQVDALTGIYNKDAFKNRCAEYLSKFPDKNTAIVFFDVDNFKDINDCLGHAVGDRALRDISQRMISVFSTRDILGRFGGDEFCALVKDTGEDELVRLLERLLQELRLEYSDGYQSVSVSVSIGAVNSLEFGNDFDKLLEYADRAQYYAKEKGKNGYALYNNELRLNGYDGRKQTLHSTN